MTIRHLKIFLEVAETGKMSAAAKKLFMAQPSVSQAIRELEAHYNTLLFERYSNKLYITETGRQLYTYAKLAIDQFDFLEDMMTSKNRREKFRIGATVSVGGSILPHIVQDFQSFFPDVNVYCFIDNTHEIEARLLNTELDVGIVEGFIKNADLITVPLVEDPLVLTCSKSHPLANKTTLHTEDLAGQDFVIRESGSGTRELFEKFLTSHNIDINIAFESHTPDSIKNAVKYNNCLTLISSRLVTEELEKGDFVAFSLDSTEWSRHFRLVYHKDKTPGALIPALENIVASYARNNPLSNLIHGHLEI